MKNFSVEVGPSSQPDGGRIRRSIYSPEELVRIPHTDVHTLYDVLQHSVKRFGEKRAFGFRKVEQIIEEEKEVVKYVDGVEQKSTKTWKYFQLSGYHYLSYKSASQLAHELGSGFVHLGLSDSAKVELFAPTK